MLPSWILTLFVAGSLFAQSSVWKITKEKETLYIGGTIHLLRADDFPLPSEFDRAFERCNILVFETDLEHVQNSSFIAALSEKMLLPPNQSLSTLLKNDTYKALEDYFTSNTIDVHRFERFHPWAVAMVMTQIGLARYGIDHSGVDFYYEQKAKRVGKKIVYLETPQEQMKLVTQMGEGEPDAMLLQTIQEMQTLPETLEWLLREWREGKTERIGAELVVKMKHDSPQMYHTILKKRNDAWIPDLIILSRGGDVPFVLVGAMHLVGEDGLLERFQRMGYTVEFVEER